MICSQRNKHLLSDIPFTPFLNLSIVYYLLISTEEIHDLAKTNTKILLPAIITTMRDKMHEIIKEGVENIDEAEMLCEIMNSKEQEAEQSLYVPSNSTGQNGAACILYEDVLKNFSEEMKMDIIILPSSTHEVPLIPFTGKTEQDELHEMVCNINRTIPVEEVLSDKVYIYKRETYEIQLLV